MRKIFAFVLLIFSVATVSAQSTKQVKWTFSTKKIADNTYEVMMTANINGNYHMYAQNAGEGPVPTSFAFNRNPLLQLDGKVREVGNIKKVYEDAFGSEVRFYEKTVSFLQQVKVRGSAKNNLAGKVEFMVCNDKECLPPATVDFNVNIGG